MFHPLILGILLVLHAAVDPSEAMTSKAQKNPLAVVQLIEECMKIPGGEKTECVSVIEKAKKKEPNELSYILHSYILTRISVG